MISPFSFSQERAMEEAKNQVTLLMDTKFSFAVRFPFNPSNINFAELEVRLVYNYTALLTVFHSYLVVLQFPASIVFF